MTRSIIHLDMDAFYASVEQLDSPELKGRPVLVGGGMKRGVVSAASYEAREFGVHSAMPMAQAVKRCPHAVVMPVRMKRYKEVSEIIFSIFKEFTPLVEPLSLDEAFLDVSASEKLFGSAVDIARTIKGMVFEKTGLTVSAGVAPNKFLAKIASDLDKPDGLTVVHPHRVQEFLDPLPVSRIWGVGRVTNKALAEIGVTTVGQLRRLPQKLIKARFGAAGLHLYQLARGIDERPVEPVHDMKSVGHEETYEDDITDMETIKTCVLDLSDRVAGRLRAYELEGSTITLKVRYSDFKSITRSRSPGTFADDGGSIYRHILELLEMTEAGKRPVRLLGVSVSGLRGRDADRQGELFQDGQKWRKKELNRALDNIRGRFGNAVIGPSPLIKESKKGKGVRGGEAGGREPGKSPE